MTYTDCHLNISYSRCPAHPWQSSKDVCTCYSDFKKRSDVRVVRLFDYFRDRIFESDISEQTQLYRQLTSTAGNHGGCRIKSR